MEHLRESFFHLHPIWEALMVIYFGAFLFDDFKKMLKTRILSLATKYKTEFKTRKDLFDDQINKIIDKDDAYKIQYSQINLSEAQQTKFDLVLEKTTQKREDLNTIKDKLSRMEFPPLQEEEIFDEIAKIKFDHHFLFFSIYTFSLLIICGFEGFWNTLFLNEIVMYNILFLIFY